jgi:hypothetical protein
MSNSAPSSRTSEPAGERSRSGAGRDRRLPRAVATSRRTYRDLANRSWSWVWTESRVDKGVWGHVKSTLDELELSVVAELEATGGVKPVGWASPKDCCTASASARPASSTSSSASGSAAAPTTTRAFGATTPMRWSNARSTTVTTPPGVWSSTTTTSRRSRPALLGCRWPGSRRTHIASLASSSQAATPRPTLEWRPGGRSAVPCPGPRGRAGDRRLDESVASRSAAVRP